MSKTSMVGIDVNNDGRADYYEQVTIPATTTSVPSTTTGIRYETVRTPITTSYASEFRSAPITTSYARATQPAAIVPYRREPEYLYQPQPYVQPYKEMQIMPYVAPRTFTHDFWTEVLRPLGLGVAAPIAGAGALVGGVVCGTGALVAGCAFGLVSTVRGVFGLLPIGVDYVLHPVAYGIDGAASGLDFAVDKASGVENNTEGFYDGWLNGMGLGHSSAKPQPIIRDDWQYRRQVGYNSAQMNGVPTSSYPRLSAQGSNVLNNRSYMSAPVDMEYDMRNDYFAEQIVVPQTFQQQRYTTIG